MSRRSCVCRPATLVFFLSHVPCRLWIYGNNLTFFPDPEPRFLHPVFFRSTHVIPVSRVFGSVFPSSRSSFFLPSRPVPSLSCRLFDTRVGRGLRVDFCSPLPPPDPGASARKIADDITSHERGDDEGIIFPIVFIDFLVLLSSSRFLSCLSSVFSFYFFLTVFLVLPSPAPDA